MVKRVSAFRVGIRVRLRVMYRLRLMGACRDRTDTRTQCWSRVRAGGRGPCMQGLVAGNGMGWDSKGEGHERTFYGSGRGQHADTITREEDRRLDFASWPLREIVGSLDPETYVGI